jgi:excisionase family DNA binding protein
MAVAGSVGTLGGSNRLLSSTEVGELLGLPERTVRAQRQEWGLQAYRIGRALRFRERDVMAWIDRQAENLALSGTEETPDILGWVPGVFVVPTAVLGRFPGPFGELGIQGRNGTRRRARHHVPVGRIGGVHILMP